MTVAVETVSTQSPPIPPTPPVETKLIFEDDFRLIPLKGISSSELNPRKEFDKESLAELADSVYEKDLLQPLVVREPLQGVFEIVAGERRFRALQLLLEKRKIADDYDVPCCIRNVDDLELIELATIENVQRNDLPILDQADAYTKMLELGSDIGTIAIKTGLAESTIKRRPTISEKLCPDAKLLVREGFITIAQAEALTIVSFETQDSVLEAMEHGNIPADISPTQLRNMLIHEKYLVENAIFDVELYLSEGGTITSDLFGDAPDSFDNPDIFMKYQLEAIEQRKLELEANWPWVATEDRFYSWEYEQVNLEELDAEESEEIDEAALGAVIVVDSNSYEVSVYESVEALRKQPVITGAEELPDFNPNASSSSTTSDVPLSKQSGATSGGSETTEEAKPKGYTMRAIMAVNQERTKALQHAVLKSKSQKLPLVIVLMGLMNASQIALQQEVLGADDIVLCESLESLREAWKDRLATFLAEHPPHIRDHRLNAARSMQAELFAFLMNLKKSELEELLRYFAASSVAKWNKGSYKLELGDFTTALAESAQAEKALEETYTAQEDFYKLFSKDQLAVMQEEASLTASTSLKKSEQVASLYVVDGFLPSVLSFKVDDNDADSSDS